jgi:hypothetical protein
MSQLLKALLIAKAHMPDKNEVADFDNPQELLADIELVDAQITLLQECFVGSFESKDQDIKVEGQDVVAAWTDGVMLSADNGKDRMLPGSSFCDFKLDAGKKYQVSVTEVREP